VVFHKLETAIRPFWRPFMVQSSGDAQTTDFTFSLPDGRDLPVFVLASVSPTLERFVHA
jgi:hypothetical protein